MKHPFRYNSDIPNCFFMIGLVFSGSLKWMPIWPIDPTILFSLLLSISIFCSLFFTTSFKIKKSVLPILILVSLFGVFYGVTVSYTTSQNFWTTKFQSLILLLFSFFIPIFLVTNRKQLDRLLSFITIFSGLIGCMVIILQKMGLLTYFILSSQSGITKLPDYLVLGVILGIGLVIATIRTGVFWKSIAIINICGLLFLTGRGPLIFAVIVQLMIIFYSRERTLIYALIAGSMFILYATFFTQMGVELLNRIQPIFDNEVAFAQTFRIDEFMRAFGVIEDSPWLGVGIGSYGIEAYLIDADIYPHNLFLEAWAEGGVVLVIFLMAIFILSPVSFHTLNSKDIGIMCTYYISIFLFFNYMKSGGFIGARDLFFFLGLYYAALTLRKPI